MLRTEDAELARTIGKNARGLRQRLKLTQEEIAEQIDWSAQVYARLEQGKVLPSVGSLMKLCEVLGSRPNDLLLSERTVTQTVTPPVAVQQLARSVVLLDEVTAMDLLPIVLRLVRK